MKGDIVYVIDGWDERTGDAFCKVFAEKADADNRALKIEAKYGPPAEKAGTFFIVGVEKKKVC